MENLINLNKLYLVLKDIIKNRKDVEEIREIIIQLHFSIQEIKLNQVSSQVIELEILEKIAMYLLTVLTNITSTQMKEYTRHFYIEGLNIAGLIFELLSEFCEQDPYQKHMYLFYCSVCYSLSEKEASSAVIGNKMFLNLKHNSLYKESECIHNSWISICKTLSRSFKYLYKKRKDIRIGTDNAYRNHWGHLDYVLTMNACCFVDGLTWEPIFKELDKIKNYVLRKDNIDDLFIISLLFDVLRKMHSKSIWNILGKQGFSKQYLMILSKYDTKNIYEIWRSQFEALKLNKYGLNYLSEEVNRAIISMPTSSGKTFIAELAIVKTLENNSEQKCIYVAPTRALCTEIENDLFYRLRRLNINVSSMLDTDEDVLEKELLNDINVLVVTPEKLDLLIRRHQDLRDKVSLFIFDEFHKIADGSRGWLLETLITWLYVNQIGYDYKILLMSAIASNAESINTWLENDKIEPVKSNWSPNRRTYCIVQKHENDNDSIWNNVNQNVRHVRTPYRLLFKYQDDIKEIKNVFEEFTQIRKRSGRFRKDYSKSDTKFDRCFKLVNYLNDNKILIYFFTKEDLDSFVQRSKDYLENKNNNNLNKLKNFLIQRLGNEHPLVKNIKYGVAYHHGDLPIEVRKEIEKAYRNGDIDILACTTTLSDGVNLPIKNFILGSFTRHGSEFKLSISDFKNIIGRAGRAYIDTEGRIFLIKHPEYLRGDLYNYFNKLLYCEEERINVSSSINKSFDDIKTVLDRLEQVIEISLQDIEASILDFIDRLQVFIFSLYEEYIDNSLDDYNEFTDLFEKLLFIHEASEIDEQKVQAFKNVCNRYYESLTSIEEEKIRKFNKTGLSFRSNNILNQIGEEIAENEVYNSSSIENIITREIYEQIIGIKEFTPKVYTYKVRRSNEEYNIDHYRVFLEWIYGSSFVHLRDTFFSEDNNISSRTQTCVNYINDMFLYKLPWAFGSLYEFVKDTTILSGTVIQNLSAIVRHGVLNLNAINLCVLGLESRELANKLADLYEHDSESSANSINEWILDKNFYYFEKNISNIDEISIRQISRIRTKLRKRTNDLRDNGEIRCEVAGLPFTLYKTLYDNKQITIDTELKLVQEPDNLYDEFAVKVETGEGNKIGYVPATHSEEVFDYIEADYNIKVDIVNLTSNKLVVDIRIG